eukprot:Hpha_TRINITY_DN16307_c2_g8::TRINITY_DN16307_c2_g8_i1::g.59372::m.59372
MPSSAPSATFVAALALLVFELGFPTLAFGPTVLRRCRPDCGDPSAAIAVSGIPEACREGSGTGAIDAPTPAENDMPTDDCRADGGLGPPPAVIESSLREDCREGGDIETFFREDPEDPLRLGEGGRCVP